MRSIIISDYKLIIICSSEGEDKSHIVSRLHSYRREWNLPSENDMKKIQSFVRKNISETKGKYMELNALEINPEK